MTQFEAKQKAQYYYEKYQEYQRILDKMEAVFDIPDFNKPFRKYTIDELQKLLDVSEKAYEWSREEENANSNIYDYNLLSAKEDRITLAR